MTGRLKLGLLCTAIAVSVIAVVGATVFVAYEYAMYGQVARAYPQSEIDSLIGSTLEQVEEFAQENGGRIDQNPLLWRDVEHIAWITAPRGTWGIGLIFREEKLVNYHVVYNNLDSVCHHNQRLR